MEGAEKDLFFHATNVNGEFDSLKEGDAVTFDIEDGDKGQSAINVTKA
jgi:CspA family cold shock protein